MRKEVLSVLFIFLFILTGCRESIAGHNQSEMISIDSDNIEKSSSSVPNQNSVLSWEKDYTIGSLIVRIDKIESITNKQQLGPGMFNTHDACLTIYNGQYLYDYNKNPSLYESKYISEYMYPDFFDDSGNIVGGGGMVVFTLNITNKNATNEYINSEGRQVSRYSDKYLFNVTGFMGLKNDVENNTLPVDFFSQYGVSKENPFVIHLEPDTSTQIQVGFLLSNKTDGSPVDYSEYSILVGPESYALQSEIAT